METVEIQEFQEKVLKKPEVFFTPSEEVASVIKAFTKAVFDFGTKNSKIGSLTPLDQLYVDGFDVDQIWEQMQLQNAPLLEHLTKTVRYITKHQDEIKLCHIDTNKEESESAHEEVEEEIDENEEKSEQEMDDNQRSAEKEEVKLNDSDKSDTVEQNSKKKKALDVAEDGFFDWDEMEKAAEEDEDEDENDYIDDGDEEEEEDEDFDAEEEDESDDVINMQYNDFFNGSEEEEEFDDEEEDDFVDHSSKKSTMKNFTNEEVGHSEDVDDDDLAERGVMSSFQRQQLRVQKEIKELEKEALSEKPWLMKGEVKAAARPENSLLEAVLDYERPTKTAPVITTEVSIELEDMIKKRILDDNYDDVIRKFEPNEQDQKKKLEDVSMEKSKERLGDIYEKEYMKNAMGFEEDDGSKKDQEEIGVMFKSLCWKLDALSNYNFTPKPLVKELQVKPSVPAIAMEEVVPIGVSDANLKAPEEVFDKKRKRGEAILQSKEEMSQQQRKALRNAKKHARRKANKQKEADARLVAKLNPGLGNKYEKKKLLESLQSANNVIQGKEIEGSIRQFSNSKEFFSRLQDEVQKAKTKEVTCKEQTTKK